MIPGLTATSQIQTPIQAPMPMPSFTERLFASFSFQAKESNAESKEALQAQERLIDSQSKCIQTQSDEIALLKAHLEQKEQELTDAKTVLQAQTILLEEKEASIKTLQTVIASQRAFVAHLKDMICHYDALKAAGGQSQPVDTRNLSPVSASYMVQLPLNLGIRNFNGIETHINMISLLQILDQASGELARLEDDLKITKPIPIPGR